ncbi:ABC transporter ATP-binding protein [Cyanobium sp. Alchichica 3B3-8F6]|uniref:ABC transporter ATP-binding protein n=1 Tax=Cyanobium sp. Alchichica 3B3-8F6 TaxID=2823696 RepID=UPI0020CC34C2|nr:ABC transporter ATP-binding protein [Cyanobium sp. Alchichica 3B3-8F6]
MPFLAVLSNPQQLWQQPLIQALALRVGYNQPQQLVLPATAAFALAAVVAALIRLLNLWLNGRLAAGVGSDLSCEVYRRTLYQPYQVHVQRNSSTLITALTGHIVNTLQALNVVLQIISSLVVAAGLLIGLLLIDWLVAVSTAGLFGIAYGLVAATSRRRLQQNGARIAEASNQRVKALQEALGAIRDVLLDGSQASYLELYRRADRTQRQLESKNVFLSTFTRYALEALGLVAIAALGGLLVLQRGSGSSVIPLLGALALGAQRLLPALQQIYAGWANLKSWTASMAAVIELLEQPLPQQQDVAEPLILQHSVRLQAVRFRYAPELPEVLQGLDLEIRRGERIGLIGSTGSGKSTLVDVLMGLLVPSGGRLLVDGLDLHDSTHAERLAGWRVAVAHVPQSIYLADSSIAENIAFGVPQHAINFERVKLSADQAQIASFIESRPEGYASFVGERGIRLSGGQRQRIGIARALYKQASVIVLDEATSALDTITEEAVMEAVDGLRKDLTIVIIAHRLSTVKNCDRVIRLNQGVMSVEGPPHPVLG